MHILQVQRLIVSAMARHPKLPKIMVIFISICLYCHVYPFDSQNTFSARVPYFFSFVLACRIYPICLVPLRHLYIGPSSRKIKKPRTFLGESVRSYLQPHLYSMDGEFNRNCDCDWTFRTNVRRIFVLLMSYRVNVFHRCMM